MKAILDLVHDFVSDLKLEVVSFAKGIELAKMSDSHGLICSCHTSREARNMTGVKVLDKKLECQRIFVRKGKPSAVCDVAINISARLVQSFMLFMFKY